NGSVNFRNGPDCSSTVDNTENNFTLTLRSSKITFGVMIAHANEMHRLCTIHFDRTFFKIIRAVIPLNLVVYRNRTYFIYKLLQPLHVHTYIIIQLNIKKVF